MLSLFLVGIFSACSTTPSIIEEKAEKVENNSEQPQQASIEQDNEPENIELQSSIPLPSFSIAGIPSADWKRNSIKDAWRDLDHPLVNLTDGSNIFTKLSSPIDGNSLVSIGNKISVWNLNTLSLENSFASEQRPHTVETSGDGRLIAVAYSDGTVHLLDAKNGSLLHALKGHNDGVQALSFAPKKALLAVADGNNTIFIWNTITGVLEFVIDDLVDVKTLAYTNDGRFLASAGTSAIDQQHTIQVWNTRLYTLALSLSGHRAPINSIVFSNDGRVLFSGSSDNTIRRWNVTNGTLLGSITGHNDDVVKLQISRNNRWLISSSLDSTIRIWTLDGRPKRTLTTILLRPESVAYIDGKDWISAISGSNGSIQIWASSGFSYQPWEDIRNLTRRNVQKLSETSGYPFVPKPSLPLPSVFKKDHFESNASFINRTVATYSQVVDLTLAKYRRDIDIRNREILKLREKINLSKGIANIERQKISIDAIRYVLGNPVIFPLEKNGKAAYNPNTELMQVRLGFSKAFFQEDFIVKVPQGSKARDLYAALRKGTVISNARFSFVTNKRVRLSAISFNFQGSTYTGRPLFLSEGVQAIPRKIVTPKLKKTRNFSLQKYDLPFSSFRSYLELVLRNQQKNQSN